MTRSLATFVSLSVAAMVLSTPSTVVANELWFAPTVGISDIADGQHSDIVVGAYAGWSAPTGFVQVGSEGLRLLAEDVDDPTARAFDLRAARRFGPLAIGLHFDFVLLGNRDRRGEVGPELSVRFDFVGGAHDIGAVYGVGRGETHAETTQYVQLAWFGFWEVEGGRGIFAKLHASYHVWQWGTLGAPMIEPSIGVRF